MRTVEFHNLLDQQNALRVRFELEQGKVKQFVVQLECEFEHEWVPVVRYDTAHGYPHCDRLHPYQSTVKTSMVTPDYNDALTFAIQNLTNHWQEYRRRYQQWREQR
ncbi:MAG: hypothetical protein ONB05_06090 [candidate division KSB1 bacterium]|nr:hypothetical protein [candidate division KSB1 bacterium]